jgi:transposase
MVRRDELTDRAWAALAPLLPSNAGRPGGQWADHRRVLKRHPVAAADRGALAGHSRRCWMASGCSGRAGWVGPASARST